MSVFLDVFVTALFFLFSQAMGSPDVAAAEEMTLPESGIRYPGGFDPNTVGEIRGKITGLSFPEKGPASFKIAFPKETYTVLASPFSTWTSDVKEALKEGSMVRVLGSKTLGADGQLYLIAQEIENVKAGKTLSLRSERGLPLWEHPEATRSPEKGSSTRWFFHGEKGGAFNRGMGSSGGGGRGGGGSGGGGGGGGR